MLKPVEGDLYFIADRIKDIDEGYFIVQNTSTHKFEVHSTKQRGSTYCFAVPFDALDARTLEYCRQTMCKNMEDIIAEIDRHNTALQKQMIKEATEQIMEVLL